MKQNAARTGNMPVSPVSAGDSKIRFFDQSFVPLLSGALFWESEGTLLLADLHLEKMSSFARSGQLLPPYDTGVNLNRLQRDISETGCSRVICLGDSFHRDEGARTLLPDDRKMLLEMTGRTDWIWLAGNHDRAAHDLGGKCASQIRFGPLMLAHEPDQESEGMVAGHLHPAARIRIGGRTTRQRCFVHDERLMILPAYGASTGNLNILSDPFQGLLEADRLNVVMIGRDRLYPVAPRFLV